MSRAGAVAARPRAPRPRCPGGRSRRRRRPGSAARASCSSGSTTRGFACRSEASSARRASLVGPSGSSPTPLAASRSLRRTACPDLVLVALGALVGMGGGVEQLEQFRAARVEARALERVRVERRPDEPDGHDDHQHPEPQHDAAGGREHAPRRGGARRHQEDGEARTSSAPPRPKSASRRSAAAAASSSCAFVSLE